MAFHEKDSNELRVICYFHSQTRKAAVPERGPLPLAGATVALTLLQSHQSKMDLAQRYPLRTRIIVNAKNSLVFLRLHWSKSITFSYENEVYITFILVESVWVMKQQTDTLENLASTLFCPQHITDHNLCIFHVKRKGLMPCKLVSKVQYLFISVFRPSDQVEMNLAASHISSDFTCYQ